MCELMCECVGGGGEWAVEFDRVATEVMLRGLSGDSLSFPRPIMLMRTSQTCGGLSPPLPHLPLPAQSPVCEAYSGALAELAAAVRHDGFAIALRDERRPAKKAALEKLLSGGAGGGGTAGSTFGGTVASCLVAPMVQAACMGRRQVGG